MRSARDVRTAHSAASAAAPGRSTRVVAVTLRTPNDKYWSLRPRTRFCAAYNPNGGAEPERERASEQVRGRERERAASGGHALCVHVAHNVPMATGLAVISIRIVLWPVVVLFVFYASSSGDACSCKGKHGHTNTHARTANTAYASVHTLALART